MSPRLRMAPAAMLALAGISCGGTGLEGSKPVPRPGSAHSRAAEVEAPAGDKIGAGQTIYVPAYSHAFTADNAEPLNLAATLYVRNTDPTHPIVVARVDYFDSAGKRVREFLPKPIRVDPMASVDFFVKESDASGGASPSFVVEWVATERVTDPVAESVMIGTAGTQGISFTSHGRVTREFKR